MKKTVTIVDYGLGNIHSVANAMLHLGFAVEIAETGEALSYASHIILPGVGAFGHGMAEMTARGHDIALKSFVARREGPLLGICLGAQMLLTESTEFGVHQGLGIIPGVVHAIPQTNEKIPHVGWKKVELTPPGLAQTLIENHTWAYFIHSFHAVPTDEAWILARAAYGDTTVNAMFGRDLVLGCQFHPEKSGQKGLFLLEQFMNL